MLISGKHNINRAIDGDIVVVEILPEAEWVAPSELLVDNEINEEESKSLSSVAGKLREELKDLLKPTGRVVAVITRKWKPCTGTLLPPKFQSNASQAQMMLFLPSDRRMPKIRIRTRQAANLLDKLLVVAIDEWPANSNYPIGHYVKQLGACGDKQTESEALLIQYDIPYHPFSESVTACLPQMPWTITEADRASRTDLRHIRKVSLE